MQWTFLIYDFGPSLLLQSFQFSAHYSQLFSLFRACRREAMFYGVWLLVLVVIGIVTVIVTKVFTYETL